MSKRVVRIERASPRKGVTEDPELTPRGYKLGDPDFGRDRHHVEHAVYVKTLAEAAVLVGKGFSLWMGAKGKRPSLIAPSSLRIVWSDEQAMA